MRVTTSVCTIYFPSLLLILVAVNPSASSSPPCVCSKFEQDYNKLAATYEKYRHSTVLGMKDIFGPEKSCYVPMKQLRTTTTELEEAKKILNMRTDAFSSLLAATVDHSEARANVSFPDGTDEAENLTSFACSSPDGRPVNLCLWVRTEKDEQTILVLVDMETVQNESYISVGNGTLYANASGLEQGQCGLVVMLSGNETSHNWSCSLVAASGDVYVATVAIKDGKATSKAVSLFTICHLLLQFTLMYQIFLAME